MPFFPQELHAASLALSGERSRGRTRSIGAWLMPPSTSPIVLVKSITSSAGPLRCSRIWSEGEVGSRSGAHITEP
jgi:hypothetical protein